MLQNKITSSNDISFIYWRRLGFKSFYPPSNYSKTKQNDTKFKGHNIFCMSASLEYIKS